MNLSLIRARQAQRGSTFLGIILGVVVGLAAALGVAIYVAKVPVPFVNKNTSRTSGQDAAEAQKNRDWDPNAPLRSRNGAKPSTPNSGVATGTVAPAPDPAPIPAPAEVTRAAPRTPAVPAPAEVRPGDDSRTATTKPPAPSTDKPAEPTAPAVAAKPPAPAQLPSRAPSNDPLGELAAARAGTATAPAADPFTYFVQAGAFRTQEDADGQRARLSLMGVEARVTEREQAGRTVYRVRVGPFQNKDAADRVKDRLDGNGFDSALVRVQR